MVPQSDNKSLNRNHTMEKMEYTSGIDPNKLSTTASLLHQLTSTVLKKLKRPKKPKNLIRVNQPKEDKSDFSTD